MYPFVWTARCSNIRNRSKSMNKIQKLLPSESLHSSWGRREALWGYQKETGFKDTLPLPLNVPQTSLTLHDHFLETQSSCISNLVPGKADVQKTLVAAQMSHRAVTSNTPGRGTRRLLSFFLAPHLQQSTLISSTDFSKTPSGCPKLPIVPSPI